MSQMLIPQAVGLTLLGGLGVVATELFRRKKRFGNEVARKLVHVLHSLVVVAWVHTLGGYGLIIIAELIFLAVVVGTRRAPSFAPLRAVGRITYGELLFPVGVILLCVFNPSTSIFTVALLHLGLADAAAAIVGKHLASPTYRVFGSVKSLAGTLAFGLTSIIILVGYSLVTSNSLSDIWVGVMLASTILSVTENLSPAGSDNLTVPLLAYALLIVGLV